MPKLKLSRSAFLRLHDAILEEYQKDCDGAGITKPKVEAIVYGYNEHEKHPHTIAAFMLKRPEIAKHLNQNNGRLQSSYLYNKLKAAEKLTSGTITITEPYATAYLLYIGCKNIEEFKKKYEQSDTTEAYKGFYFSRLDNRVNDFELHLTHNGEDCIASLTGFFNGNRPEPFTGAGRVKSRNLFLNLENKQGIEMKLIIPLEGDRIRLPNYIPGVLTTISSDDFPLSVRFLLAKKQVDNRPLSEEDELRIRRYITLHRQTLRASKESIRNLRYDLKIRGEDVESLAHMVGTYWIWQYMGNDIVQLKMIIQEDYSIHITNPLFRGNLAEQMGVISINRTVRDLNICISVLPKNSEKEQTHSFFMIELPMRTDHGNLLKGAFSTVEQQKDEPFGGALSLIKEAGADLADLEPQIIKENAVDDYLEKYVEFIPVKMRLDILSGKKIS